MIRVDAFLASTELMSRVSKKPGQEIFFRGFTKRNEISLRTGTIEIHSYRDCSQAKTRYARVFKKHALSIADGSKGTGRA